MSPLIPMSPLPRCPPSSVPVLCEFCRAPGGCTAPPPQPPAAGVWERRLLAAIEGFRYARRQHRRLQEEAEPTVTLEKVMAAVTEISVGLRDARGRLERLEHILGAGQPPRDPPPPHPETPPPPQDPHHPKGLVPP
ncbi:intermediate conductance calcium-activated potassium channel protein 4-like [Lagopus muta]|uniref:intermediate conductance calcium-activated potassium channel protein 4-like n=1 Tax=Lagopus muta TaxID=64668 RepID=UPI0020A0CD9B|nr:intermediate conductance calcium-activated potassium channel protein 4-like [Lagopus muta]